MIVSMQKKSFEQIQHPLMIKVLNKLVIKGNSLKVIKTIYENHIANILSDKQLEIFLLRSGTRQGCAIQSSIESPSQRN